MAGVRSSGANDGKDHRSCCDIHDYCLFFGQNSQTRGPRRRVARTVNSDRHQGLFAVSLNATVSLSLKPTPLKPMTCREQDKPKSETWRLVNRKLLAAWLQIFRHKCRLHE